MAQLVQQECTQGQQGAQQAQQLQALGGVQPQPWDLP